MGHLGTTELIIILVVVVVVFGAGKLPEIGGALGQGLKDFRKATRTLMEPKRTCRKWPIWPGSKSADRRRVLDGIERDRQAS